MNRFLKGGMLTLLFFVSTAPVYAANLPLLDPNFSIVPSECRACPCGAGGALQFIQNLMNAAVSVGVVAFVLIIAYAGFLLILTPTNPESRSRAKGVLGNATIGFIIVLAAWLIVDFIMKILYSGGGQFGPWNKILSLSGDTCIVAHDITPISGLPGLIGTTIGDVTGASGSGGGGGGYGVGVTKGLCADSNTACSVSVMKSEGLNDAQAQAMSCIAVTESGGNPGIGGSGTGAQGLFQITGANWSNPAFHKPPCSVSSSRDNATCNRQAAVLMFKSGGYQPWTGKCMNSRGCGNVSYGQYWNPNAVACVSKYDPGH